MAFLFLGFLLLRTEMALQMSEGITVALAAASHFVLRLFGAELTRAGAELRNIVTGNALSVTEACDGLGIVVTSLAILISLQRGTLGNLARWAVFAFVAIQASNFLRIILLYWLLPSGSAGFQSMHFEIFPRLSAALVALVAWAYISRGQPLRWISAAKWLAIACVAGVGVYLATPFVLAALILPLANMLSGFVFASPVNGIALEADGYVAITSLAENVASLKLVHVSIEAGAFILGLPLLAASLALSGARAAHKLALSLAAIVLMTVALLMAAHTDVFNYASTHKVDQQVAGEILQAYALPPRTFRILLATLQNVVVHFNLFVLPFLIFFPGGQKTAAPRTVQGKARKRRA